MYRQNRWVFAILSIAFLLYSYWVYTGGTVKPQAYTEGFREGQQLWQKHNCTACHQLYGLGGYLGPDLTNVATKGEAYLSAFLKSGVKSMPVFQLTEKELDQLYAFLSTVNESGSFPNKELEITALGNYNFKNKPSDEE